VKNKIKAHPQATVILLAFVGLGIIYSLATPPLEAGDESRHYAVVKYMADTGQLPVQKPGEAQIHWSHEGNQPPLYYALAAALTFWIETGSWHDVFWYNPHAAVGVPLRPDNKNMTIHRPGELWDWRGHILVVHLIRFFSLVLATITVATSYLIALNLFKGHRHLAAGAMAATAFNPMFIFISASVNNDNLVIMLVTLTLWGLIRNSESKNSVVLLAVLIGLGALSKLYAVGLLPLAMGVLLWRGYQARQWKASLKAMAILLGLVLLIAGWFYMRNMWLYGDGLALDSMRKTAGMRHQPFSFATWRAEFEGLRIAYWALFGGVNILVAPWIYTILDGVSLVAVVGLVAFILDFGFGISKLALRFQNRGVYLPTLLILLSWCIIMVGGFLAWNLTQPAMQGRLFYPAIAAISALGVLGVTWWLPAYGQTVIVIVSSMSLFLLALLSPFLYIVPHYAKSTPLLKTTLPAKMHRLDFTYDNTILLIGYQLPTDTFRATETIPLTLYWQLLKPAKLDYSIFIHLLGRQREVIGQLDTYPDSGRWPTTLLSPGDILADHYEIPIRPQAEFTAPSQLLISTGIYDYHEAGRPGRMAVNAEGQPVEPIIAHSTNSGQARLKLIPWQWPRPTPMTTPVNFSDKVTLLNYERSRQAITLTWQVSQSLEADYTVFIQAWQQDKQIAGFDSPPMQGDYPTSLWTKGEIIVDVHPINLPNDKYNILMGLYRRDTGERLPAFQNKQPLKNYAFNLE